MLRAMSARQFEEWAAFYSQEPWGEFRADLRTGIVASTIANIHRKPRAPAFTPIDFMPYAERPPIAETETEYRIETFLSEYVRR